MVVIIINRQTKANVKQILFITIILMKYSMQMKKIDQLAYVIIIV